MHIVSGLIYNKKRDDFLKIAVTNMMLLLEKTRGV